MAETGVPGPFEPDLVNTSGGKWRRVQSQPLHFWSGFFSSPKMELFVHVSSFLHHQADDKRKGAFYIVFYRTVKKRCRADF